MIRSPLTCYGAKQRGYACSELDALGWRMLRLSHTRAVRARAGGRLTAAPEGLWLSPRVPGPLPLLLERAW
jgi:hypothetical protein